MVDCATKPGPACPRVVALRARGALGAPRAVLLGPGDTAAVVGSADHHPPLAVGVPPPRHLRRLGMRNRHPARGSPLPLRDETGPAALPPPRLAQPDPLDRAPR